MNVTTKQVPQSCMGFQIRLIILRIVRHKSFYLSTRFQRKLSWLFYNIHQKSKELLDEKKMKMKGTDISTK